MPATTTYMYTSALLISPGSHQFLAVVALCWFLDRVHEQCVGDLSPSLQRLVDPQRSTRPHLFGAGLGHVADTLCSSICTENTSASEYTTLKKVEIFRFWPKTMDGILTIFFPHP